MDSSTPTTTTPVTSLGECAICMNEMCEGDSKLISCKHRFHETCVVEWFDTSNKSCPLCRGQISGITFLSSARRVKAFTDLYPLIADKIQLRLSKIWDIMNANTGQDVRQPYENCKRVADAIVSSMRHRYWSVAVGETGSINHSRSVATALLVALSEVGHFVIDDTGQEPLQLEPSSGNVAIVTMHRDNFLREERARLCFGFFQTDALNVPVLTDVCGKRIVFMKDVPNQSTRFAAVTEEQYAIASNARNTSMNVS